MATRWTSGPNSACFNHTNKGAGAQTVVLPYAFQANTALREEPVRVGDPEGAGPSEHVFPPPPGGALTVELFPNDTCTGAPLATQSVNLTTTPPAQNPTLVAACTTLQVAVVLDESGSIGSAGATQSVRNATTALAEGLVGTGASMAVFKFSTNASPNFIAPYQPVTPGFVTGQLATYLAAYNPSGFTNWDGGLRQVQSVTGADPPDLVIFLTDGNPNRSIGPPTAGTGTEEGYYTAMTPAVATADAIKGTGSHMFVIGVGTGVTDPLSQRRLQAMSGPDAFPPTPIADADYTVVTDFTLLEEALRELASNLCDVTVNVTKQTDDATPGVFAPKAGWPFSGTVTLQPPSSPLDYAWVRPTALPAPQTAVTQTQAGVTGANGTLTFDWRPTAANALSTFTVTEPAAPAGYTPGPVTCTQAGATLPVTGDAASFTLNNLGVRTSIDCVVRNTRNRSTVRVVKQFVGPPSPTTIFVDSTGTAPFDASTLATASGASAQFSYPVGSAATVGETSLPAGYTATIACGEAAPQPYTGGPFNVTAPTTTGATLTCTITNTAPPPGTSTVRIVKQFVGTPSSTTIFVDSTGTAPFDASTVATASGASAEFSYPVGSAATVGETSVPAGYTATINCGQGAQPYTGGPFAVNAPVAAGQVLVCTLTNTAPSPPQPPTPPTPPIPPPPEQSTVQVVKTWVGTPSTTTIFVDADGQPPFDASIVADTNGASTSHAFPVSTSVTVGETGIPSGFTATIDCGQGAQTYSAPITVSAPSTAGATLVCRIVNTANPAPPPQRPMLVIEKVANKHIVRGGNTIQFTITIRARGQGTATNVQVCDVLPPGLVFVRAPGATFSGGRACWRIASISAGQSRSYRVTVRANSVQRPTFRTNVATVTSPGTDCTARRARRAVHWEALGASLARCSATARVLVRPLAGARAGGVTG
jgi:uncharacterized repeat protein (TIGR01451 family)